MFKNAINEIKNFYTLKNNENLFEVLGRIIPFTSAYIFFIMPDKIRLEYSYNPKFSFIELEIPSDLREELFSGVFSDKFYRLAESLHVSNFLVEPLMLKNTVFGFLLLENSSFSEDEKVVFRTCAQIISSIVKDREVNKIISLQVKALQEVIFDTELENKRIKQSEELKTDFLSHVSHEIRTPLNSIIGYADILSKEFVGKLNKKQKEFVNDIQISGIYLLGMVNEILDLSKLEAGMMRLNLSQFDISECVNECCNVIMPLAQKKNVKIKLDVSSYVITADYQKLQQILFNLLSNAIKFTLESGQVEISTCLSAAYFVISVKDNGIGIPIQDREKIFAKYEQGEIQNREFSTGLGLAITRELITLHGGRIEVISECGKGTEFKVFLQI